MSLTPDNERGLTPVAFDRDGLRLSVEPEFESRSGPQTPIPPPIQDDLLTPEGPRSTIAVMIIKPHATKLRLKIEKRIVEAGFEILKERKMGFHLDSSGVVELFGPDAPSLSGDPVWVYVLSRARAASALAALAGPLDPLVARKSDPESLRALYGSNRWENGVWTTKDEASAERIVSALFAGSPIMELSDLPSVHSSPDRRKLRKSASHTSSLKSDMTTSTGSKPLSATNSRASLPPAPKPGFKARAVPASITSPTIVPRMTRAAALRAGKAPPPPVRPRMSEEERERTFEGVPGHKRRESISVSSTAPPAIVPRVNKSAMLRAQKKAEGDKPKTTKFPSTSETKEREKTPLSPEEAKERNQIIFDGVPGHKRRESITVASTAPPAVVPRVNRSSMLRAQKIATNGGGAVPPSSFKVGDGQPTRSLSTRSSQGSIGPSSGVSRRASIAVPRPSPSKCETKANNRLSLAIPRDSSMGGALTPISNGAKAPRPAVPDAIPEKAPKLSPKKPDIVPRTNKSALLRAAAKLKSAASGGSMGSMGKGPAARKSLAF